MLPMVVPAESSRYLKALVHYESPVALKGSEILQLVYKVSYPLVLMYSGRIGIVTGVVLRGEMELMGSPVFHPAQHLETVTKIKTECLSGSPLDKCEHRNSEFFD